MEQIRIYVEKISLDLFPYAHCKFGHLQIISVWLILTVVISNFILLKYYPLKWVLNKSKQFRLPV